MSHSGVSVRHGVLSDLDRLVPLLEDARQAPSGATSLGNLPVEVLAARLAAFVEGGQGRISLAEVGMEPVGIAIGQLQPPGLFSETTWLQLEVLLVIDRWRRRGFGRALVADQARYALEVSAPRIVTQSISGVRSEARFLSRLGFTATGSRREIETAALVRRLDARDHPRAGIESLIARRRVLHPTTPLRGIPVPAVQPGSSEASTRQVRRAELMRRSASSQTSMR